MPPKNARSLGSKRYYQWGRERFWSVTTIIGGGVPKHNLQRWAARVVAEGAVKAQQERRLAGMVKQDPDATTEYLKALPWAKTSRAADIGTRVHEAIESLITGAARPPLADDEKPRMMWFDEFVKDYRPTFIAAEASIYNRTHGYAGTFDALMMIEGVSLPLMLDVKTGKAVYHEAALQLSAYRRGEFIGMPDGTEAPLPETAGGVVLHLRDDGYDLLDVDTGDHVFAAFIYAREVNRWMEEGAKTAIGSPYPMPAPIERAPDTPSAALTEPDHEQTPPDVPDMMGDLKRSLEAARAPDADVPQDELERATEAASPDGATGVIVEWPDGTKPDHIGMTPGDDAA